MGRAKGKDRVLPPKWSPTRKRWRVRSVTYDPAGSRIETCSDFQEEGEAHEAVALLERELLRKEGVTVAEALEEFWERKRDKGRTEATVKASRWVLTGLFAPLMSASIGRLHGQGQVLYDRRSKQVAPATHQAALQQGREFSRWAVGKGYLKADPFAGVEKVGKARRGKEQPTDDEMKRLLGAAHRALEQGRIGALFPCLYFYCGLRASEPLTCQVRDLDRGGSILRVVGKGGRKRWVHVPEVIQPYLRRLAEGKDPGDRLIPIKAQTVGRRWTLQMCREAGIPPYCPHSLRGKGESDLVERGNAPEQLSAAYGHTPAVARAHYLGDGVEDRARRKKGVAKFGPEILDKSRTGTL